MNSLYIALIVLITTQYVLCFKNGTETIAGYGDKKKKVTAAGGNALDLAVGMLEGPLDTSYPYGDNKQGDAANFGIFKQNWEMIRKARSEWSSLTANDYKTGEKLNKDLNLDVDTLHKSQKRLGMDLWYAGHRAGSSGKTTDQTVKDYRAAVEWIRDQINKDFAKFSTDNTRIWVDVTPI